MASVTFQLLCLLAFYVTLSESCRADQCTLLPSTPDISSEFHSLASENGVRIIYLSLKVGNSSYRPLDHENVFFPERWVWANSISEPMLSMGYEYDIFSLSLLNNQARSMDVHLIEEPSGCLADLNSSCQSNVVEKVLLQNVTEKNSDKPLQRTDVVCVAMIAGKAETFSDYIDGNIRYRCCEVQNGKKKAFQPPLHCDLNVKRSKWFTAFDNVLLVVAWVILFYCPAFPFALPEGIAMNIADEIKKEKKANDYDSREERGTTHGSDSSLQQNEDETLAHQNDAPSVIVDENPDNLEIPVDDTSPITCSVLLQKCAAKLPGFQLSFNIKLVFLSYFVVPVFLYINILLTLALKGSYLQEAYRKQTASLGGIAFYLLHSLRGYEIIPSLCFFLAPFVIAVSVKPKDLIENVKATYIEVMMSTTYERTLGQRICMNLLILQDKVHQIFSSSSQSYLNGLEKFLDFTIRAFIKRTNYSVHASRMKRLLCVFCVLISSLLGVLFGVVLGGIFLIIFLVKTVSIAVFLSPSACALGFLWSKLINELDRHKCPPSNICAFIVTFLVFLDSVFAILSACATVTFSCFLIIEVFGYTLMGLILNADIATPYAVFALVVATNVYLCYANLQNRYKEAKGIISKEWHKNKGLLLQDSRHLANSNDDTISKELFWFVCGEDLNAEFTILPIQTEIFHMFCNIICILAFLFLSLCAIIFFSDLYQLSTLASSIAVFITGVIPKLFLQGFTKRKSVGGWEKIKITRQIQKAVKEYIDDLNNGERPRPMPEEFMLRNMMYTNMPQ